jgi:hypothetical protein
VPVANPDFLTATDIVFFSLIFVPIFPDAAMLEGTRGHFEPELWLAFESRSVFAIGSHQFDCEGLSADGMNTVQQ